MSSPPSLRQRGGKKNDRATSPGVEKEAEKQVQPNLRQPAAKPSSEWDYKLALFVVTVLAFATRFYNISYPDQVVFDEVHFGKVSIFFFFETPPLSTTVARCWDSSQLVYYG